MIDKTAPKFVREYFQQVSTKQKIELKLNITTKDTIEHK